MRISSNNIFWFFATGASLYVLTVMPWPVLYTHTLLLFGLAASAFILVKASMAMPTTSGSEFQIVGMPLYRGNMAKALGLFTIGIPLSLYSSYFLASAAYSFASVAYLGTFQGTINMRVLEAAYHVFNSYYILPFALKFNPVIARPAKAVKQCAVASVASISNAFSGEPEAPKPQ